MKIKTLEKLRKRFEKLPLHHIDGCVLLEALKETKLGNVCGDYLNRVGYKYRGSLSSSVLGELFLVTFRDTKSFEDRDLTFRFIDKFLRKSKIKFTTPDFETFKKIEKIRELEPRIEETDALHLATAFQEKADAFVTFDDTMLDNRQLEKEFGIRIAHPRNL